MENNTDNQEYRFQPEQIDWKTMEKFGLNQEKLEKMNALDPLLRGFKTNNLIPITINLGTTVSKMDVRLPGGELYRGRSAHYLWYQCCALWRMMKQVLPVMRDQADGLIINVTSGFGRVSFPFATVYSASKFALGAISEDLHYEIKRLGIDVAIVELGASLPSCSKRTIPHYFRGTVLLPISSANGGCTEWGDAGQKP